MVELQLFWLQSASKFAAKMRTLLPRSARLCALFWLHSPSKSQLAAKMRELLPRFTRLCDLFWHQSPSKFCSKNVRASASLCSAMCFILGSISVKIRTCRKMRELLPRFARLYTLFWLQSPSKLAAKMRELLLRLARLCALFWLQSPSNLLLLLLHPVNDQLGEQNLQRSINEMSVAMQAKCLDFSVRKCCQTTISESSIRYTFPRVILTSTV